MRRRMYLPTRRSVLSGFDADRGQILKPALRLHEAVNLWRQPARVEVERDEDHRRFLVHCLVQLGQQRQALGRVELAEDAVDQLIDRGVAEMTPIGPLG